MRELLQKAARISLVCLIIILVLGVLSLVWAPVDALLFQKLVATWLVAFGVTVIVGFATV